MRGRLEKMVRRLKGQVRRLWLGWTEKILTSTFHYQRITYAADGLITSHSSGFSTNESFLRALEDGRREFVHPLYHTWRLYLAISLMDQVRERCLRENRKPVFVECGVGEGHTVFVFAKYLQYRNERNPNARLDDCSFYLLDTFAGVDMSLVPDSLKSKTTFTTTAYHGATIEVVRNRFSFVENLHLIQGSVPASLGKLPIAAETPDFLHVDMNNPVPEVEALKYFVPNMAGGAIVLLDD